MSEFTELEKLMNYVCDYVDNYEVSDKICNVLIAGEKCRNTLVEIVPDSSYAEEIVKEYDEALEEKL